MHRLSFPWSRRTAMRRSVGSTEAGQQLRGDVDVLVPGHLGLHDGDRQRRAAAHARQLDEHGQVDTGDDVDIGLVEYRDGKVVWRAAEHVGQQYDAVALLHLGDAVEDVTPALL